MSTPVSSSPYVIICNARIGIAAAGGSTVETIQAASAGAAQLVSFMQSYYKHFKPSDCVAISTLQHELMDYLNYDLEFTREQINDKIKAMVKEMYELEKKYTE